MVQGPDAGLAAARDPGRRPPDGRAPPARIGAGPPAGARRRHRRRRGPATAPRLAARPASPSSATSSPAPPASPTDPLHPTRSRPAQARLTGCSVPRGIRSGWRGGGGRRPRPSAAIWSWRRGRRHAGDVHAEVDRGRAGAAPACPRVVRPPRARRSRRSARHFPTGPVRRPASTERYRSTWRSTSSRGGSPIHARRIATHAAVPSLRPVRVDERAAALGRRQRVEQQADVEPGCAPRRGEAHGGTHQRYGSRLECTHRGVVPDRAERRDRTGSRPAPSAARRTGR